MNESRYFWSKYQSNQSPCANILKAKCVNYFETAQCEMYKTFVIHSIYSSFIRLLVSKYVQSCIHISSKIDIYYPAKIINFNEFFVRNAQNAVQKNKMTYVQNSFPAKNVFQKCLRAVHISFGNETPKMKPLCAHTT